jgi:hypothetical protein
MADNSNIKFVMVPIRTRRAEIQVTRRGWFFGFAALTGLWMLRGVAFARPGASGLALSAEDGSPLASESGEALEG